MTAKIGSSKVVIRVTAWLLGVALAAVPAAAQTAQDLVGTWRIATVTAEQSETQVEPYGPDPKGILMFDENGRYTLVLLRPDLPTFASSNRTAGTPEENRAVVQGSIAHFGTYAVEGGDTLVLRVQAATFPNWNGAEQKRPFTLTGGKLEYTVPVASGGARAEWSGPGLSRSFVTSPTCRVEEVAVRIDLLVIMAVVGGLVRFDAATADDTSLAAARQALDAFIEPVVAADAEAIEAI